MRWTRTATALVCAALLGLVAACTATAPRGEAVGTLRLYVARHGETDWNLEHRLQGWTDTSLNATGQRQATDLAETLKGVRLDAKYSSTLQRSRITAETVAGTAMSVTSLPGLRERNYGRFQGGSDTDPEYVRRANVWDDNMDGGETLDQLLKRARESLDQVRREHPTGNVLIVGHRITNQSILQALMDFTPEQASTIQQANDEVYLVELDPGAKPRLWKLVREQNLGDL